MNRVSPPPSTVVGVRLALARLGLELGLADHDGAEAALIGVWATRAGEVDAALAPVKKKTEEA